MDSWQKFLIALCIGVAIFKIFGSKAIIVICGIITLVLLLVYYFQNSLLYMPDIPNMAHSPKDNPQGYRHPSQQGLQSDQVSITTSDNVNIKGWHIKNEKSQRLVIYFHENAGNLGYRIPFIKYIHQQTQSDVLLVAYRGYSDSEGKPTEQGLQQDAIAIMSYAVSYKNKAQLSGQRKDIYLLGRSLGGAVSIYLAEQGAFKNEIKGLILQNTFTSIQDMVGVIFPILSHVLFLLRNFWPSHQRIKSIEHPILFVKSLKDQIVPPSQMNSLIQCAQKCRLKDQYEIPTGTHNVAWQINPRTYFAKMNDFFSKVESI